MDDRLKIMLAIKNLSNSNSPKVLISDIGSTAQIENSVLRSEIDGLKQIQCVKVSENDLYISLTMEGSWLIEKAMIHDEATVQALSRLVIALENILRANILDANSQQLLQKTKLELANGQTSIESKNNRQILQTIRNVLEGATGSLVATGLQPYLESAKQMLDILFK